MSVSGTLLHGWTMIKLGKGYSVRDGLKVGDTIVVYGVSRESKKDYAINFHQGKNVS